MNAINEQEYFKQRVESQINWYENKSKWNKSWFTRLKSAEIILALVIPFLSGTAFGENSCDLPALIAVGIIGIFVAAVTGLITLLKLQENWFEYRSIAESLKHEKYLYLTKAGPYKERGSFSAFVERFESYISKENTQWASYIKSKGGDVQDE